MVCLGECDPCELPFPSYPRRNSQTFLGTYEDDFVYRRANRDICSGAFAGRAF